MTRTAHARVWSPPRPGEVFVEPNGGTGRPHEVTMTQHERLLVSTLGPHTREHVLVLLARCPGLTLTSARRSPDRNRRVGGSPGSFHLKGRAADFTGRPEVLEFALRLARAERVGPRCTGTEEALIHDSGTGVHLHLAW
jgi:hypothetical protein